eukprot:scaffold114475_cov42-Attheya_sp.AAC.2
MRVFFAVPEISEERNPSTWMMGCAGQNYGAGSQGRFIPSWCDSSSSRRGAVILMWDWCERHPNRPWICSWDVRGGANGLVEGEVEVPQSSFYHNRWPIPYVMTLLVGQHSTGIFKSITCWRNRGGSNKA